MSLELYLSAILKLKRRRSEISQQIKHLEAQADKLRREKGALPTKRHSQIAQSIFAGASIKESGKKFGVGPVGARYGLHEFCRKSNPTVYQSGFHHNIYADGSENDCPPSLKYILEHKSDFMGS